MQHFKLHLTGVDRCSALGDIGGLLKWLSASPVDLLLQREQIEQFLRDKRAESENDTLSLSEAAKYLYCDPMVLPTIIDEGLLESVEVVTGTVSAAVTTVL